jgi:lactoylglutathione lyase
MKNAKAIGHVAVSVRDIERSMDFYVNKLGFAEMFRLHRDEKLWIVYLRITDTQFIELFPGGVGEGAPPFENVGFNHLCIEVDDLDGAIAELTAKGVTFTIQKKLGVDDNYQAWVADPEGNRIELMQLGKNAMQTAAIARLKAGK